MKTLAPLLLLLVPGVALAHEPSAMDRAHERAAQYSAPATAPALSSTSSFAQVFTATGAGARYEVDLPGYRCALWTGRTSTLRITRRNGSAPEVLLGSVRVATPAKGSTFTLRCSVLAKDVLVSLNGKINLLVLR